MMFSWVVCQVVLSGIPTKPELTHASTLKRARVRFFRFPETTQNRPATTQPPKKAALIRVPPSLLAKERTTTTSDPAEEEIDY